MSFKFLNIPVKIELTFWIFFLFFTRIYEGFTPEKIGLGLILILSLLVHEYGHALTAAYFGAKPKITLEGFGGFARYNSFGISRKKQFLITLNGPLFESLLIVVPFFLLKSGIFASNPKAQYFLSVTMHLNIYWCLFNLLPIKPLDGGYIFEYLLKLKFKKNAEKIAAVVAMVTAIGAVSYLIFMQSFFFATLVAMYGIQYFKLFEKPTSAASTPFSFYMQGMQAFQNNDLKNAKSILKKLLNAQDKQIKISATETLAKIYLKENEKDKCYQFLLKSDHHLLKEGKYLLCLLAFEQKNYQLIADYSKEVYDMNPSYDMALLNSKAFAYLSKPIHSGAWLHTASLYGVKERESAKDLILHEIYRSVRDQEGFKQYAEKI